VANHAEERATLSRGDEVVGDHRRAGSPVTANAGIARPWHIARRGPIARMPSPSPREAGGWCVRDTVAVIGAAGPQVELVGSDDGRLAAVRRRSGHARQRILGPTGLPRNETG